MCKQCDKHTHMHWQHMLYKACTCIQAPCAKESVLYNIVWSFFGRQSDINENNLYTDFQQILKTPIDRHFPQIALCLAVSYNFTDFLRDTLEISKAPNFAIFCSDLQTWYKFKGYIKI